MRLVKMLGFAAVVAVIAMAFIGASTASALTRTALCKVHEQLCSEANQVKLIHLQNTTGTVLRILNSTVNVLCLSTLVDGNVLSLAQPQLIHIISFTVTGCGTDANHNNCTMTSNASEGLPWLASLLRAALNLGIITLLEFEGMHPTTRMKCTIFGFIKIDCTWNHSGLEFEAEGAEHRAGSGHGMLTANESPVSLVEGSGLCPEENFFDFLLEPLEDTYIVE
jgi:hypothetical protein